MEMMAPPISPFGHHSIDAIQLIKGYYRVLLLRNGILNLRYPSQQLSLLPLPRFTAIDFETADYGGDSACAIGLVVVDDGEIVDQQMRLIRPPRNVFHFTHIHGLTWNDVKDSPEFVSVWRELEPLLEGSEFLVAHNARFDEGVLKKCCQKAGIKPPEQRFVCTVRAARRTWKLKSARLNMVCEHLGIPLNHHEALSDATACAKIAVEAMRCGTKL